MEGLMIVFLVIGIPVILFPVAFVWYLNVGGIVHALRQAKAHDKKAAVETTK